MRTTQEIIEELDLVIQMQIMYDKMKKLCSKKIYYLQQEAYEAMEDQEVPKITFKECEYKQEQDLDFKLTEEASAESRTWDELPAWREFVEKEDPGLGKEKWTVPPQTRKAWLKRRKDEGLPLPDFAEPVVTDTVKYPKKKLETRAANTFGEKIMLLEKRLGIDETE